MQGPNLIDRMTRSYLCHSLYSCHEKRVKVYSTALNIIVLLSFLGIFGSALYYCFNKRSTPFEKYQKDLKDQEYILEKIRHFEITKTQQHESLTNLPNIYSPTFSERK